MQKVKLVTNIGQLVTVNPLYFDNTPKDPKLGIISDAEILIEGELIKWVGRKDEADKVWFNKYEVIDAGNNVVMPGFIDSHTHLIFAGSRHDEFEMRLQGATYAQIAASGGGISNTVNATRKASFDDLYKSGLARLNGMQSLGVTTVEIKSGYGLSLESELKSLQVIKALNESSKVSVIPTFMGAHSLAPEFKDYDSFTDYICNEMIPAVAKDNLAKFCDVFCEEGYFSLEQSRKILNTGKEYGLKPKIHADEFNDFGVVALALEVGAVSADHLICMNHSIIPEVARSNLTPTVMPGVSVFLSVSPAPARKMLDNNVNVAVATDFNPGSNMCESLLLSMIYACLILKMTPAEVIRGVTVNAAKALDLNDRGSIEVGKRADLTFFNIPSYQYLLYHYGMNHLSRLLIGGEEV